MILENTPAWSLRSLDRKLSYFKIHSNDSSVSVDLNVKLDQFVLIRNWWDQAGYYRLSYNTFQNQSKTDWICHTRPSAFLLIFHTCLSKSLQWMTCFSFYIVKFLHVSIADFINIHYDMAVFGHHEKGRFETTLKKKQILPWMSSSDNINITS